MNKDKWSQLQTLYDSAERYVKLLETGTNTEDVVEEELVGLLFAPINELRYAGRHMITAVINDSEDDFEKAMSHCHRAIYDALDIRILIAIERIDCFLKDYRDVVITNIIPDFATKCITIDAIRNRHSVRYTDRETYWQECEEDLKILEQYCIEFNIARQELNKLVKQHNN